MNFYLVVNATERIDPIRKEMNFIVKTNDIHAQQNIRLLFRAVDAIRLHGEYSEIRNTLPQMTIRDFTYIL